jgi:hypothetical protein
MLTVTSALACLTCSLAILTVARKPAAAETQKLIVSLDAAEGDTPRFVCIVSGAESKDASKCDTIPVKALFLRDLLKEDSGGRFAYFRAPPEEVVSTPQSTPANTSKASRKATAPRDCSTEPLQPALRAALVSLSAPKSKSCDEAHELCVPRIANPAGLSLQDGHLVCGENTWSTRSNRSVFLYLKFHDAATKTSAVQEVEVLGTEVTLHFRDKVDDADFSFAIVLGGSYVPALKTSVATKERIVVALNPRCSLYAVELPPRSREQELGEVRFVTKSTSKKSLFGAMRRAAERPSADCIVEEGDPSIARVMIPYAEPGQETTMSLQATSRLSKNVTQLEGRWTSAFPPRPFRIGHRSVEFSWRPHCLAGILPEPLLKQSWSGRCPLATIDATGQECDLVAGRNYSEPLCRYVCPVLDTILAVSTPLSVRFDRIGVGKNGASVLAYSWKETLAYSGQELESFPAHEDRRVIVKFNNPEAWKPRLGDRVEAVRLTSPDGTVREIDFSKPARAARSQPTDAAAPEWGGHVPPWTAVQFPALSCVDSIKIDLVGTRDYRRATLSTDTAGSFLVLNPSDYVEEFKLSLFAGGGVLSPVYGEALYKGGGPRFEFLIAPIGMGSAWHAGGSWPGAWELDVHYELTRSSYGPLQLRDESDEKIAFVWYHRGIASARRVVLRNVGYSEHAFGAGLGVIVGGPVYSDVDRVGDLNYAGFVEGLWRFRLSGRAWFECVLGIRLGEAHQYFSTDSDGRVVEDYFGEPIRTQKRLIQATPECRVRLGVI